MVFGSAFYGSVGYGRLGEVGLGVVCKVLSGRRGGARQGSMSFGGAVLGRHRSVR
jgi:hypothetical protein